MTRFLHTLDSAMLRRLLGSILLLLSISLPLAAAESVDAAMKDVERLRSLAFLTPVRTVTLDRSVLTKHLRQQIERSLPYSFDDYMVVLTALRLVDPAAKDPESRLVDLMQQQVLAFYDPSSHVYYSISGENPGVPDAAKALNLDDAVTVHELTHALQDQRFHIGASEKALRDDADASLALHSLLEGEASLVMLAKMMEPMGQTVASIAGNDALVNATASAAAMMRSSAGDTPRYFLESLAIPYTAGLRFVIAVYRKGGWDAVNRVYDDPPASMREVLHPDEYLAARRFRNGYSLQPPLPLNAHLLTVEHLGEWHWNFLLGGNSARGWVGDRVTVAQDRFCQPTVLVETQWDSPASARAFRDAYLAFLEGQKIDPDIRTSRNGRNVYVAYGADFVLADRFLRSVP